MVLCVTDPCTCDLTFVTPAGGVSVSAAHSMVSNRKTSTITDVKGMKDKHGSVLGGKTNINTSSIEGGTGSQVYTLV